MMMTEPNFIQRSPTVRYYDYDRALEQNSHPGLWSVIEALAVIIEPNTTSSHTAPTKLWRTLNEVLFGGERCMAGGSIGLYLQLPEPSVLQVTYKFYEGLDVGTCKIMVLVVRGMITADCL